MSSSRQNGHLPIGGLFLGQQWGVRSPVAAAARGAGARGGHLRGRRSRATFVACCLLAVATSLTLQFAHGAAPEVCILVGMVITYAGFTECVRMAALQDRNFNLTAKVKQLLESRRASGLKRLGHEVGRLQMWPRPPYSYTATVLRRFDAERSSPMHEREVNYRALARDLVSKIVEAVGGGDPRELGDGDGESVGSPGGPATSVNAAVLRTWLLQRLMHEGPTPERDPDLFKSLHDVVDLAEEHAIEGFYCRLCLSYHSVPPLPLRTRLPPLVPGDRFPQSREGEEGLLILLCDNQAHQEVPPPGPNLLSYRLDPGLPRSPARCGAWSWIAAGACVAAVPRRWWRGCWTAACGCQWLSPPATATLS